MLDHLSIQCADVAASAAFYEAALAPIGAERLMDFGDVIGFGVPPQPDFWLGPLEPGAGFREAHIAFVAPNRDAVDAFHAACVAAGMVCNESMASEFCLQNFHILAGICLNHHPCSFNCLYNYQLPGNQSSYFQSG